MATSGQTIWTLDVTEIMEEAFERAGVDKLILNADHMRSSRRSMNFILKTWANVNVRPWAIERTSFLTTAGVEEEYLQQDTIDILDATLKRDDYEIPMTRLSRSDYQAIPDKAVQGRPDRFYLHKDIDQPSLFLYQTPDNSTDEMIYWRIRRLHDVTGATENVDVPARWLDAFTAALAYRLCAKRPEPIESAARMQAREAKLGRLKAEARELFDVAAEEDRDRAPLQVVPDMTSYTARG